jgi:chemotaxis protein MotB
MRWIIVVAVLVTSAGCVKKSTHQRAVAALEAKLAEKDKSLAENQRTIDDHERRIRELEGTEAGLRTEKEATDAELAELREKRAADEKRLAAFQDLQDRFKSMVDAGDLEIAFRNGQMTLKLPSGVLFPGAKAELSPAGQKTLTKVVKVLKEMKDRRFLVAGHTDDVPIATEEFANNWYLSTARAISVVQFMVDQGMSADQLGAAGYADKDPIASNKKSKGRKKNRRIEIILVPELSELPKLAKDRSK